MCRLFGWFNPELPEQTDRARLLKHLARKSQAGGEASFGMAMVTDGKPKMVRHIGTASTWLETHKKDIASCAESDIIIGHTRQPTKGAVTKANCHPFTIGEWAAAHNGCISNSSSLMEAALYSPRGETDSEEALCYIISADWNPEAINKITGSYAFAAAKADGSEAVLVCDNGQNLHFVRFGEGIIWATSGVVLKSSLAAVGIDAIPIKLEKSVLRLPEWSRADVDTTYHYTQSAAYSKYHGYGSTGGIGTGTGSGAKTFPGLPAKTEDPNAMCECDHPQSEHRNGNGCFKSVAGTVCPCNKFDLVETKILCPNVACKHEASKHSSSWGCMAGNCPCEIGKLPHTTGASQPTLPMGSAKQETQDESAADHESITDAELEMLRASQTPIIDITGE